MGIPVGIQVISPEDGSMLRSENRVKIAIEQAVPLFHFHISARQELFMAPEELFQLGFEFRLSHYSFSPLEIGSSGL
jgi:hypothetical protein